MRVYFHVWLLYYVMLCFVSHAARFLNVLYHVYDRIYKRATLC